MIKEFIYRFLWLIHDKSAVYKPRSKVPTHEIMQIVRMYHPTITAFFENKEDMVKFEKWREEKKDNKKEAEGVA